MTDTRPPFDQLVFSGGGLRCFWQGGFLDVVRDEITLQPARIAGVSGGALAAACFIAHQGHALLNRMMQAFDDTDSNIAWHDFEKDGVTPHQRVYREVVTDVLTREAMQAIADGPLYQVLLAHPPLQSAPKLSGSAATIAYEAELHTVADPHFDWARKLGVTTSFVDARQAARDGTLVDLVVAAATIPPVFEPPHWNDKPVIDGGMADQAPMPDPDKGATMVLLTRQYSGLKPHEDRRYLEPSQECPVDKIDFTSPDKLRTTWKCGQEDGRAYLKTLT